MTATCNETWQRKCFNLMFPPHTYSSEPEIKIQHAFIDYDPVFSKHRSCLQALFSRAIVCYCMYTGKYKH